MLGHEGLAESPLAALPVAGGGGAVNYTLSCAAGAYSYTGNDATLTWVAQPTDYTLTCDTGAYAYTGKDATLVVKRNYTLVCAAGSYAYTGVAATLTYVSGVAASRLKYWDGAAWQTKTLKYWDGGTWATKSLK